MNSQLDANDLVNALLEQIGSQAKEIAILKAHLAQAVSAQETETPTDGDE